MQSGFESLSPSKKLNRYEYGGFIILWGQGLERRSTRSLFLAKNRCESGSRKLVSDGEQIIRDLALPQQKIKAVKAFYFAGRKKVL